MKLKDEILESPFAYVEIPHHKQVVYTCQIYKAKLFLEEEI